MRKNFVSWLRTIKTDDETVEMETYLVNENGIKWLDADDYI